MAKVNLTINGKNITADSDQTILEVVHEQNLDTIPTLCHSPKLDPYGSCFVCVVEVEGMNRLVPSCATKVGEGMKVITNSDKVRESRKTALELLLSNHFADCVAPCEEGCPAHVDVQGYMALVNAGRYEDAIRLIKQANPLPIVCGRICVRRCEVVCRRGIIDEPVAINYMKRYATDMEMDNTILPEPKEKTGKRVAIVGGGPAGIAVAFFTALEGHTPVIYEKKPHLGGMLRYGIPEYRLPKALLDKEIEGVLSLGGEAKTNVELGKDFTVETLIDKDKYDAVFVGLGAWVANSMRVEGEYDTEGVYSGLKYLIKQDLEGPQPVHGTVVIIGGGNTAIDVSRTALRNGAKKVIILYRRSLKEMPADPIEIHAAQEEGIEIRFLSAPTGIVTQPGTKKLKAMKCVKMELGEPDASGRRRPVPIEGSEYDLECDFVFSAIGQKVDLCGLDEGKYALETTKWNTILADEELMTTSQEKIFAGGDAVTGPMAVADALGMAKIAAHSINTYLEKGKAEKFQKVFVSKKDTFGDVEKEDIFFDHFDVPRTHIKELPVAERIDNVKEVEIGFERDQIVDESKRCLECGCQQFFDCDLQRFSTDYDIEVEHMLGEVNKHEVDRRHPFITIDNNKCILCQKCIRTCETMIGESALGLVNRGYNTVVRANYDKSLLATECNACGNCVDACPTGALTINVPYGKPGPWATIPEDSVSEFGGEGADILVNKATDDMVIISGEHESFDMPNMGELDKCSRFGYWYMYDDARLVEPMIRKDGELNAVDWNEAIDAAASRLNSFKPEEIAVMISAHNSLEDSYLAGRLAKAFGEGAKFGTFSGVMNPRPNEPKLRSTAAIDDIYTAENIVVVNCDPFGENFAMGHQIIKAKRSGAILSILNNAETKLSKYADHNGVFTDGVASAIDYLARFVAGEDKGACETGDEIGENIKSKNTVVIFGEDSPLREPGVAQAVANLMAKSGDNVKLLVTRKHVNKTALHELGFSTCSCVADKLRAGEIKAVFVIGENPLNAEPTLFDKCELVVSMDSFMNETAKKADIVLPASSVLESGGNFINYEGRIRRSGMVAPSQTGTANFIVLAELCKKSGAEMKVESLEDVHAMIFECFPEIKIAFEKGFMPLPEYKETAEAKGEAKAYGYTEVDSLYLWLINMFVENGVIPCKDKC